MTEQPLKEPAWLVSALDQRLALMEDALRGTAFLTNYDGCVITSLTEPDEGATEVERERWERTCDHCGRYCPDETSFYIGRCTRLLDTLTVHFSFGVCEECKNIPA